jgi:glyoxylase-like metal-dependent hydrolase (beta-lactamase superfamily II)
MPTRSLSARALAATAEPWLHDLGDDVFAIDTGFHRDEFDAAYLVVHGGEAAFIDTGTHFALPRLLAALEVLGLERAAVSHVIPTHVHLDHAGGVGSLMAELPRARCLVHPRGARHMADPGVLWQGATAVYGEAVMRRDYGCVIGVAADRIDLSEDGMTLRLGGGRKLRFADTPGHAKHHHCIWDERSGGWFTGDTFGLSYPEFDNAAGLAWILPTSTPVQFEPDALVASIQRMLSHDPQCLYLTHYSRVTDVPRLGENLLGLLSGMVALGRTHRSQEAALRHGALKAGQLEIFTRSLREHGCDFSHERIAELLAIDLELNAQGMAVWLDR